MPIKIDAPRADGQRRDDGKLFGEAMPHDAHCPWWDIRVRIVRETDYRKLMAVVRAAEELCTDHLATSTMTVDLRAALDALRGKEAKRA